MLDYFYKYGLFIVFIALVALFSSLNKNFFTVKNSINLLQQTSSTGIAAVGLVFVMLTGGIDVSIGSVVFMTSVIVATLTSNGLGMAGAFFVAIGCGALVGCVNGFLCARLKMAPLIVTLAMLYIIRGTAISIVGIRQVDFTNPIGTTLARMRLFGGFLPVIVLVLAAAMVIGQFILVKTSFGRQLFAIGNNKTAAQKMGIKVERNIFVSYILCGAFAGLSGLISGAQVGGISPTFATGTEFIIISATVLGGVSLFGGKGSVFPGAFLGVLVIMCIENGLVMASANMYAYTIVRGVVIFLAVLLDSVRNTGELR
jgi:ribose/xylose/arabinose/galactoside ABC-type transport system permease subunit